MRSVLLMLVWSVTQAQFSSPCPASCVVCSEDTVICHKLSSIIGVPDTTKALLLTDGLIDSVDNITLSDLSNMTVLGLSNNAITTIVENAFQNLTLLTTLLLDHNQISSQTLPSFTFSRLHRLEILQLGNNALQDIDGSWFQSARSLKTLQLEGNLLTSLNSSTFDSTDLRNLEILDLSDNLITFISRESFRKLPRLRSLDLSRNRLQNVPDAFSSLSWLSMLNLALNRWNCTCELRELASFLNSYNQAPHKVLHNGQKMVCVSADNPAVQTVLELTEANCVQPKTNSSMQVETINAITSQRYIRDIAIAATCCFAGGVAIALGVLCIIHHKLGLGKNLKEPEEGKTSSQASVRWEFSENKEALSLAYAEHRVNQMPPSSAVDGGPQTWSRERSPFGMSPNSANHFTCHLCSSAAPGPAFDDQRGRRSKDHKGIPCHRTQDWSTLEKNGQLKEHSKRFALQSHLKAWGSQRQEGVPNFQMNGVQGNDARDKRDSKRTDRMQRMTHRRPISPQGSTATLRGQHHGGMTSHVNGLSRWKEQSADSLPLPFYQTISCLHCHRTYEYRQAGNKDMDIIFRGDVEQTRQNATKMHQAMLCRETFNYNQFYRDSPSERYAKELGVRLDSQRSVTFDLPQSFSLSNTQHGDEMRMKRVKSSEIMKQKDSQTIGHFSDRAVKSIKLAERPDSKSHKPKAQSGRLLKVKINLNPLRKSRVLPNPDPSQEHDKGDQQSKKSGKKRFSKKGENVKDTGSPSRRKSKRGRNSHQSQSSIESKEKPLRKSQSSVQKPGDPDTVMEEGTEKQENKCASFSTNQPSKDGSPCIPYDNTDNKEEITDKSVSSTGNEATNPIPGTSSANQSSTSNIGQAQQESPVAQSGSNSQVYVGYFETQIQQFQPSGLSALPQSMTGPLAAHQINTPSILPVSGSEITSSVRNTESLSTSSMTLTSSTPPVVQEYLSSAEGSPKRKIRLILPEKTSDRPQTALEKKIR